MKMPKIVSLVIEYLEDEPPLQMEKMTQEKYDQLKRKDAIDESKGKVKKIVVMIARGELVLAVVLHIVFKFYGGEYDPLYVERVKQTLFMLYDEKLFRFSWLEISTPFHSAKLVNKAPPMHVRVPKKSSKKQSSKATDKSKKKEEEKENLSNADYEIEENKNQLDQPRVSIVRSSELLSHEMKKNKNYDSYRESTMKRQFENSSYIDHPSRLDEEEKSYINMSMKAPLDNGSFIKRFRNSSADPKSRQGAALVKSHTSVKNKDDGCLSTEYGDLMRIDPISIPMSKAKLYHFQHIDNSAWVNSNPPIKAGMEWFTKVYQSIFRAYSYLYPVINLQELHQNNHITEVVNLRELRQIKNEEDEIFDNIMETIKTMEDGYVNHNFHTKPIVSSPNFGIYEIGSQIKLPIK
jgi:hypothetical protein